MNIDVENSFFQTLLEVWQFVILTVDGNAITVGTLTIGLFLFVLGVAFSRSLSHKVTDRLFSKWIHERSSLHSVESLSFYFFLVFFTLFALKIANIPLTIFTVLGGALAIGFGFGSQNIVNNLISGLILMIEKPIKVGDFIDVDGIFGEVQDIGMRSTRIRAFGNRHMIVPNSSFLDKNVLNWTHSDNQVRANVRVGAAYGSDARQIEQLLIESVETCKVHSASKPDPKTMVLFHDFGDDSLIFDVYFWIDLFHLNDMRTMESNLRYAIYSKFKAAGITIAFPQRDVHLDSSEPLRIRIDQSNDPS